MSVRRITATTVTYTCNCCKKEVEKKYHPHEAEPKPEKWMKVETTEYSFYGSTHINRFHYCGECKLTINKFLYERKVNER
jgi:hypothetical protein